MEQRARPPADPEAVSGSFAAVLDEPPSPLISGNKSSKPRGLPFPGAAWVFSVALLLLVVGVHHAGVVGFSNLSWPSAAPISEFPIKDCSCGCWDTILKKGRGTEAELRSEYRTIYINTDRAIIYIGIMCVVFACSGFNMFHNLFRLYFKGKLRRGLAVVALLLVYPNIYSFWATFNYLNDRWFPMIRHQVFFGLTEWIATAAVVYYLNQKHHFDDWTTMYSCSVGIVHIVQLYGFDEDILRLHNKFFRNLGFAVGDLALILYFGRRIYRKKLFDFREKRRNVIFFLTLTFSMFFFLNVYLPNE